MGVLIASEFAKFLGMAEAPRGTWLVFAVQAQLEDAGGSSLGASNNNPLNLSALPGGEWPGQIGVYYGADGHVFAAFATPEDGARACALNYAESRYYEEVRRAFASGDVMELARAVDRSPWNAGGYGSRIVLGTTAAVAVGKVALPVAVEASATPRPTLLVASSPTIPPTPSPGSPTPERAL